MSKQDIALEELADEHILPHLKDMPGSIWEAGAILAMVDDNLPAGSPDVTRLQVEEALEYLQEGGAVLHLAGKGWTAI